MSKYLLSIVLFIFTTFNVCYGQLSLSYKPEEDPISFLRNKGFSRGLDYKSNFDEKLRLPCIGDQSEHETLKLLAMNLLGQSFNNLFMDELYSKVVEFSEKYMGPDDKIIFLGRSPLFLKSIFETLLDNMPDEHFVSIFYSGSPDVANMRGHLSANADPLRNLVTENNLNVFNRYLDHNKLNQVKGKIYIVDIMSTGSSINSFLRILANYYRSYLKIELPDIYLVPLNLSQDKSCSYSFRDLASFKYMSVYVSNVENKKLEFSEIEKYGIKKMSVDTIYLNISNQVAKFLDNPGLQMALLKEVEFPAYRWTDENVKNLIQSEKNLENLLFFKSIRSFIAEASRLKLSPSEIYDLFLKGHFE